MRSRALYIIRLRLETFSAEVRCDRGFTLVEIMIALGLTALLAMAIASLFYSAGKQQTRIEARSNIFEFQQKLLMDIRTRPLPSPSP